ncbi:hypothetical protein [Pelagibacterium montanilacus]|uniref:hypothetical protein n=1 Tax=Pelagibacterium montanilacus TaxID=2185280 RepID=UPI000F8F20A9|nr:hypothetical protein [Pelagibacterium montanilacus]
MNVANLQLEGLYLTIAALNDTLVERGVISRTEIDAAMKKAERAALDARAGDDLSPAQRDAMAFPARFLILANAASGEGRSFQELARQVGETKNTRFDPS